MTKKSLYLRYENFLMLILIFIFNFKLKRVIFFLTGSQSVPCITFTFVVLLVKAHSTKTASNSGSKILRI